jgi:hypothetical protein
MVLWLYGTYGSPDSSDSVSALGSPPPSGGGGPHPEAHMREPRRCFRVGRPRVTRTPSRVQTTTRSNRRPVLLVSRAKAFQLAFTVFEKACFSTPFSTPFQKPSLRGRPPGTSREAAVTWRERMGQVYSRQSWRGGCVTPPSFARRVRHGEQTDAASVSHRPCA